MERRLGAAGDGWLAGDDDDDDVDVFLIKRRKKRLFTTSKTDYLRSLPHLFYYFFTRSFKNYTFVSIVMYK